jgi:hypothetical protein
LSKKPQKPSSEDISNLNGGLQIYFETYIEFGAFLHMLSQPQKLRAKLNAPNSDPFEFGPSLYKF